MPKLKLALISCALITSACATSVPLSVSCPKPPPLPESLIEPVSTGPDLSQRFEFSLKKFQESLNNAARQ